MLAEMQRPLRGAPARVTATLAAFFLLHGAAGLRKAAGPPVRVAAWRRRVRGVLSGALLARAPSASEEERQGDSDDGGKEKQPVAMQVSEEELERFVGRLSSACGDQFAAIMRGGNGSGAALHTFEDEGGPRNVSALSCERLNGSLCFTTAHVEEKVQQGGRRMKSQLDMKGDGCLPNQCVSGSDLQAWAVFMQSKAKEQLPGMGITVQLNVNCTASGGTTAVAGPGPEAAAESDGAATGSNGTATRSNRTAAGSNETAGSSNKTAARGNRTAADGDHTTEHTSE